MIPFTDEQKTAIKANEQNLRIIACAGSGKTSTIAGKVTFLLNPKNGLKIEPKNIIAFTYTDRAAAELKNKILNFLKENPDLNELRGIADMYIGTIHGWCLNALQNNEYKFQNFSVLDEIKLRLFVDKNYYHIGMTDITKINDRNFSMRKFVDTGRFIQIMNIIRESDCNRKLPENISKAKEKYEKVLRDNCYFDFTMIMTEALNSLHEKKGLYNKIKQDLKYLIVDEYQDVNPIQEELIKQLYLTSKPIVTVVGDDDQNIYQWRGSNNRYIKDFLKNYRPAKEVILNENFRSSKGITSLAETLIFKNNRIPKKMISAEKQNFIKKEDILYNEFVNIEEENNFIADMIKKLLGVSFKEEGEEKRGLDYSDFAILLRTWNKSYRIVEILDKYNIPYITAGVNELFEVNEAKAAVGIFQYLNHSIKKEELIKLWQDIPKNKIKFENLNIAIKNLTRKFPENHIDKKRKPIWAYSLQDVYWSFIEIAKINEETFEDPLRGEIIMFNLGKFSQVINDFESINFNSSLPEIHLKYFLDFITYAANDYYPEGWLNNPYKTPRAVQIMTIHQAKGLEFPVVFIPGLNKNYLPTKKHGGLSEWHFLDRTLIKNQDRYEGNIEDERRLFYVAITRAQKYLFISRAPDQNNQLYRKPSIFVSEISASNVIVTNIPDFKTKTKLEPKPKQSIVTISLNFSILKDFFECPYRFKLVSMYGFCYPLDQRMGFGKSLHNSLMEIHKRSMLGEVLSLPLVRDIAKQQSYFPYLGKSSILLEMKELVENKVVQYFDNNKKSLKEVEFVEQDIQLHLDDGIFVSGRIDLIKKKNYEGKYETTIIEFKSSDDVQKRQITIDQLNLYAMGHKELTGQEADYIQIYDLETNTQKPPIPLSESHLEMMEKKIKESADTIRKQSFIRTKNREVCKDCFQYRLCSYGSKHSTG
ncbi:MAG: ATP-dependent DNA helicase [Candidatus Omnitrophota bacterium]